MKTRITITKLIAITMAITAMAVVGSSWSAEAQHVRVFDGITFVGFIPGETLRFSVGNLSARRRGGEPVRAQVKLYDAQGNVIARSQEVEVLPGQFHTFNFNRDDLPLAGEPGTGRLQVGVDFQFQADASTSFSASMETVDNRTGQTLSFFAFPGFMGEYLWGVDDSVKLARAPLPARHPFFAKYRSPAVTAA